MVIILMGVAGSGKTVLGRALAAELGWRFEDADSYHSAENIAKMHRGHPLDDADRAPWLARLHALITRAIERREHMILACSALKQRYRETLRGGLPTVRFVFLTADKATLRRRLETRAHHFAGPALVDSQLTDLEPPSDALTLDTTQPPDRSLAAIRVVFGV
ncbi:MAG TPA: gluconokinase [Vicinamibacterales bacterium]|jgi:carbohydrate kinase (thermoresistant glucokinase family)